jgi:hypothetical protein
MIILIYLGAPLAVAFGLAIALNVRARRSRVPLPPGDHIEAKKAESPPLANPFFGRGGGSYFPAPDDGRPPH